jgi:hypothetical protein
VLLQGELAVKVRTLALQRGASALGMVAELVSAGLGADARRLSGQPHWPELRRYAEMTSRHPACRGEDFDRAGEWTMPTGTGITPALVDDLAHLTMMHSPARR